MSGLRYHFRRRVSLKSMPPNNSASSSWLNTIFVAEVAAPGQRNLPPSNFFEHIHSPLWSYTNSFSRLRRALVNKKTWPLSGSQPRWSRTKPYKPLNPLRMSVAPVAT